MAILLGVLIPLTYLIVAALTSRYVYFRERTRMLTQKSHYPTLYNNRWEEDSMDATGLALFGGVFWPVVLPFYLAFTVPLKEERKENRLKELDRAIREVERKDAEMKRYLRDHGIDS